MISAVRSLKLEMKRITTFDRASDFLKILFSLNSNRFTIHRFDFWAWQFHEALPAQKPTGINK